jgi:flagellar M-ring protein FliF
MKELWNNVLAFWNGLEKRAQTGVLAGGAGILVAVTLLGYWTLHTDYQVLFADMEERDAGAVVEELKRRKMAFQLGENGTKVLVPAAQVHETRLALMNKGVVAGGGVGFEIFDNKDLGMTEYTQKVNYQRALQGELARTIMASEQVKLARVHLVVPEASLFKRDKSRSKASVSLVLKPGARFSAEQVLGIQRLVAAAVPGLEPGMVTVFDQRGVTLSSLSDAEDATAGGTGKLKMKRDVEDYFIRKIGEVMDRTFGPGKAIVSVDVALNFDEIKRTQHDVLPLRNNGEESGIAVRKRQVIYRQGGGSAKATEADPAAAPVTGTNSTTEVEYEIGRRVEEVVMAPGGIRRISVGVLVPQHMTSDQQSNVQEIVSVTAGLSESRGDAIAVHSVDELMLTNAANVAPAANAATGDGSTEAEGLTLTQMIAWAPAKWVLLALLGAALLVGAIIYTGIQARARRRAAEQEAAAEEQRATLLAEIKGWIDNEKASAPGATNV